MYDEHKGEHKGTQSWLLGGGNARTCMTGCQGRMEAQITSEEGKKEKTTAHHILLGSESEKNSKQTNCMGVHLIYESCSGEKMRDICLIKYL